MPITPGVNAPTLAVLQVLLERQDRGTTGLDIGVRANLGPGAVLPTLARLERLNWVDSHWQARDRADAGRDRRRLYQLSSAGIQAARQALQEAQQRHSEWTARLRPVRGLA